MPEEEITAYTYPVGIAIREYLLKKGEACPNDFYSMYKSYKPTSTYQSIARTFYILRRIGLIKRSRKVKGKHHWPKQMYMLVEERFNDPAWYAPQQAIYPETGLGRRRYRKAQIEAQERGISIRELMREREKRKK